MIGCKSIQLREAVFAMKDAEKPSFKENAMQLFWMSRDRMELTCQLQDNDLLGKEKT